MSKFSVKPWKDLVGTWILENSSKTRGVCVVPFFKNEKPLETFWTGTDENAIIELLGNRTNKQRVPMVAAYKTTYGKVPFVMFLEFDVG